MNHVASPIYNGGMPTEYLYLQMTHIFFLLNLPPHQKEKKEETP